MGGIIEALPMRRDTATDRTNAAEWQADPAHSTVLGHLLTALTHGRTLNLCELQQQAVAAGCSPPSRDEWDLLDSAPVDVVRTEKVVYTELLSSFLPEAAKPVAQRSESDKEKLGTWYPKVAWFLALRRIGCAPRFDGC